MGNEKVNGFGIASLVLGIVGVLLACLGIGAVFGLIGVILGILGLTVLKNAKKGIAIAGTIVSGVALFIGVGLFATGFASGLLSGLGGGSGTGTSGGTNALTGTFESTGSKETAESEMEGTYEDNNAFDIVEKSTFTNSIGTTYVIHKVKAKKDTSVTATMLAYDGSGNVIGKAEDSIVLTKGENNYFQYFFTSDVSNAKFEVSANIVDDSIFTGDRNAVVMQSYNKADNYLYITVKQVGELSGFEKFKILYYKNGKIIESDDGYYNVHATGLTGTGTTDVIELLAYGIDFDKIEFIYEP